MPTIFSAFCCNSSIVKTGICGILSKIAIRSLRWGLIATPTSVTNTSIHFPGVINVVTSFTTVGIRPRTNGAEMIVSLAVAAS